MEEQSRVVIVCGKGGVGKTTLSLALALRHASAGRKVVVVSSHPLSELALAVSLAGLGERHPAAAKNLFVVHLDAKELLAEVIQQNFPLEWAANAVLNSRIYKNLIEVAPGLKEFYFLARLQKLAERKAGSDGNTLQYDLLLWDAPATGHFLGTLRAAKNFNTYLTGPLAEAGADLARFFSNAETITFFPVTTLEEMAVQETIELCAKLEAGFGLRPAALLLNLVSPVTTADEAGVADLRQAAAVSSDPALRFAVERGLVERGRVLQLRSAISRPAIPIERVRHWDTDLQLLEEIGRFVDKVPVGI